ncbi:MAG TPA: histidine kinase [Gaiellaceae bacterium]|jgi:Histidine kinase
MTDAAEVDELRASLARVLAVADEERRRIERDLHDGAQQHLVAIAVNAQLARQLAESDPKAALDVLEEIGRDARVALEAIRELAAVIFPPLLVDRGLAEALRAAASAHGGRADVDGLPRQFAAFEAFVYFCAVEALAELGGVVRVRAREVDGQLELVFERKAGDEPPPLFGLRDRVAGLGGRVNVEGGTVTALLPLPR